jgi:subtilisin family serine protease
MSNQLLRGARSAYSRPELVVGYKHIDSVRSALDMLGIGHVEVDRDYELGLGLLRLDDDRAAASVLGRRSASEASREPGEDLVGSTTEQRHSTSSGRTDTDRSATDLDACLTGLRRHFRKRYAGWAPLMGKNRMVGHVIGGGGKISHGGGGPLMATKDRLPKRDGSAGTGVRVGVLDTSMSSNAWLAGAWTSPPGEVLGQGAEVAEVAGHATFVAGLVLQQAPACVLEARSVLSNATGEADSWSVAKAIVQQAMTEPHVMNLSFVCYTEDGQAPLAMATAIERIDPDTVVVAAAGNHGDLGSRPDDSEEAEQVSEEEGRKPAWPAALDRVVAVGSADSAGELSPFTPHQVQWIDVLAPGDRVLSTFLSYRVRGHVEPFSGYARWSGTSFAAASVSGAIAARTKPGVTSPRQAWARLQEEAQQVPGRDGPRFLPLA